MIKKEKSLKKNYVSSIKWKCEVCKDILIAELNKRNKGWINKFVKKT